MAIVRSTAVAREQHTGSLAGRAGRGGRWGGSMHEGEACALALAMALRDRDGRVRVEAARALGAACVPRGDAAPLFARVLRGLAAPSADYRRAAVMP